MANSVSNKYISKLDFMELLKGDRVIIRFMVGIAHLASPPYIEEDENKTDILKQECADVHFSTGPWKGKTLSVVRHQISIHRV